MKKEVKYKLDEDGHIVYQDGKPVFEEVIMEVPQEVLEHKSRMQALKLEKESRKQAILEKFNCTEQEAKDFVRMFK